MLANRVEHLTKILQKTSMSDEDWEDLDLRAASTIRLCLAKNVLANVHVISNAKELWEKLEALYQAKDHLSTLNGIISELEAIGVKIEDEDKALRLILSLPHSYKHMKPILMYGKETLIFVEVTSKLISKERRLMSDGRTQENSGAVV
ncbi:hypothetical protein DH2020_021973 [Rehmannia glutinosa]|uniref:Uncharacterized protein n=1 Tax=Rehmannia glutinosa TaxID=99300 RepID=A0ABR0WCE2_REHGL